MNSLASATSCTLHCTYSTASAGKPRCALQFSADSCANSVLRTVCTVCSCTAQVVQVCTSLLQTLLQCAHCAVVQLPQVCSLTQALLQYAVHSVQLHSTGCAGVHQSSPDSASERLTDAPHPGLSYFLVGHPSEGHFVIFTCYKKEAT